jgi:hypothetical protein
MPPGLLCHDQGMFSSICPANGITVRRYPLKLPQPSAETLQPTWTGVGALIPGLQKSRATPTRSISSISMS